jgi:myo-inositol 2-dehydrogenase/D-chiro-inositol 1-dehydrogenase
VFETPKDANDIMTTSIGVIGAGRIGKLHAENLALRIPNVQLTAIADVMESAAQETAAKLHIPIATGNYKDILANPNIQAVAICSATDTHSQMIIEAAQAGKHIFCEKPIDFDLRRIDAALDAVEKAGVILQIGFNRRFDPNFSHVQEVVASGAIGDTHILRITSRDPAPPPVSYIKVSGGIFLDMTIHDFDMARFLIGSPVVEVFAAGAVRVDSAIGDAGDIDTAVTTLRFENNTIGIIDNSRKAVYGYDQRVEVFGSKGSINADNNTPHRTVLSDASGVHKPLPLHFFLERYSESYVIEMKAFVQAVERDEQPPVVGIDGRIPVVIGLAATKSYRENRPVKISEIG